MAIPNPFIVWSDISAPVTTDAQGAIKMALNADAVKVSIDNILQTNLTERVMHPEFGSNLRGLLFEVMDEQLFNTYGDEIRRAIETWDTRVHVEGVNFKADSNRNTVEASIHFIIRGYDEIFTHTTLV